MEVSVTGFDADQFLNGASGTTLIAAPQSDYGIFTVNISAPTGDPTASIYITVSLGYTDSTSIGSTFHVDDFVLSFNTGVTDLSAHVPIALGLPSPSPFDQSTSVVLGMKRSDRVHAEVVDALGRPVELMVNGPLSAGLHRLAWYPQPSIQAGLYFIRVRTNSEVISRPVVLW